MSHSTPVFIVGCPRSGTYLLLKLISVNLDFASPIETHFIPYFRRYCFLYGNLEKKTIALGWSMPFSSFLTSGHQ